jgi:hypothetical protein
MMTRRQGRRCMQLVDGLKGTSKYWKLEDCIFWRTHFGRRKIGNMMIMNQKYPVLCN